MLILHILAVRLFWQRWFNRTVLHLAWIPRELNQWADGNSKMIDRDDWRMGEDVVLLSAFPSGALRSLEDPHNGAAQGDYGSGFQPKHVNEQFKRIYIQS
jgi:hypothetical protein